MQCKEPVLCPCSVIVHWCFGGRVHWIGGRQGWEGYLVRDKGGRPVIMKMKTTPCDNRFPGEKYGSDKNIKKALDHHRWNKVLAGRYIL